MNKFEIRSAILKAADQITNDPASFLFTKTYLPNPTCGSPGCALGWIGYFLKYKDTYKNSMCDGVSKILNHSHQLGFYRAMDSLSSTPDDIESINWRKNAATCAMLLREYADKYFPDCEKRKCVSSSIKKQKSLTV